MSMYTVSKNRPTPIDQGHEKGSVYHVISRIAYLTGVPRRIFENEYEPPKLEIYEQLQLDKNARIVRNLCMLRTSIEQNYESIQRKIHYDFKNIHTIPEDVPTDCIEQLESDGVPIIKANHMLNRYIIDINKHIVDRINNCKHIFPSWLNWDYVRDLFVMPKGLTEAGIKSAAKEYYANKAGCPYQVYMNWPYANCGNILYNDRKFVTMLYEAHEDRFTDFSKVTDAGEATKDGIYRFLEESTNVVIAVDCENSDPYKLYATLNNLDQSELLNKVRKIILCDDVHTGSGWSFLERFTDILVEHRVVERVKDSKSLVDTSLTAVICKECYRNGTDSVILVSSDSDYWGLINSVDEARFLVMVEDRKCGPDIKRALDNAGITYCYIDDFCTGNSYHFKTEAMLSELNAVIAESIQLNVYDMLDDALCATRINMTDGEKNQFFDRYLKPMRLSFAENGNISIALGA